MKTRTTSYLETRIDAMQQELEQLRKMLIYQLGDSKRKTQLKGFMMLNSSLKTKFCRSLMRWKRYGDVSPIWIKTSSTILKCNHSPLCKATKRKSSE